MDSAYNAQPAVELEADASSALYSESFDSGGGIQDFQPGTYDSQGTGGTSDSDISLFDDYDSSGSGSQFGLTDGTTTDSSVVDDGLPDSYEQSVRDGAAAVVDHSQEGIGAGIGLNDVQEQSQWRTSDTQAALEDGTENIFQDSDGIDDDITLGPDGGDGAHEHTDETGAPFVLDDAKREKLEAVLEEMGVDRVESLQENLEQRQQIFEAIQQGIQDWLDKNGNTSGVTGDTGMEVEMPEREVQWESGGAGDSMIVPPTESEFDPSASSFAVPSLEE